VAVDHQLQGEVDGQPLVGEAVLQQGLGDSDAIAAFFCVKVVVHSLLLVVGRGKDVTRGKVQFL